MGRGGAGSIGSGRREAFPAAPEDAPVQSDDPIGDVPELAGRTLLPEKSNFNVLAVVFDRLYGADVVVVACYQYGHILVVLESMGYHVRSELDVYALFEGRAARPLAGIDQPAQAKLGIRDSCHAFEELILVLEALGFFQFTHESVVIIHAYQSPLIQDFLVEARQIDIRALEISLQRMVHV
jgi:hypothetical protein